MIKPPDTINFYVSFPRLCQRSRQFVATNNVKLEIENLTS